ncbi:MAG: DUF1801 domain-containing protein [Ilumatobacter sp.]|jgi:hypothetical protein|uniref:DUF1801 domain-containing protein n=1 Tax=Ilumatobacter sp. TaxID=1967498 RepID=UPI00391D494C
MAENLTTATDVDPYEFIAGIEHPTRRADALALVELMARVTGWTPTMWGPTMIGFGHYRYQYDSGHRGEYFVTGFSPRKAHQVVYVMSGLERLEAQLAELGKHRSSKSCLYINKLVDVDLAVLEAIVADGVAEMARMYEFVEG